MRGLFCTFVFAVSSVALSDSASAQLSAQESVVVRGSYVVIGNGLIDCPTPATCDNNDSAMIAVDVDPIGLGDLNGDGSDDTTMSSASTLALPPGAIVKAAFLAVNGYASTSISGDAGATWTSTVPADYPALLAPPGGPYAPVSAYGVGQYYSGRGYHARYDVTDRINASGEYWLADARSLPATHLYNRLLSWTLVVVYEDGSAPKLVNVYDGTLVCINNSTTVPISGFLTPASGPISALFTIVGNDGYAPGPNTESIRVGNLLVSNPSNPSNAIGNGTVSGPNGPIARNPSTFFVTEPIDIDTFDVSSAFTNSQSNIDAVYTCQADGVVFTSMILGMDVLLPDVTVSKSVDDTNGAETLAGDELVYRIDLAVTGGDDAEDVVLRDPIPEGTTFVAGSITLVDGSTIAITDVAGDDQGELDGDAVVVRIGDLGVGERSSVRFTVSVDTTSIARTIANLGLVSFRGAQGGSGNTPSVVSSSPPGGVGPTTIAALPCAGFQNGACPDAGVPEDAATEDATPNDAVPVDEGLPSDVGFADGGAGADATPPSDSGPRPDAASDAGFADSGVPEPTDDSGCDCTAKKSTSATSPAFGLLLAGLLLGGRRRRAASA